MPKQKKANQGPKRKLWLLAGLVLLVGLFYGALYSGIVTSHHTIETGELQPGQSLRLAVVGDLHSHIYGENQSILLEKLEKAQPDALLLVGDIYDNGEDPLGVEQLLAGVQGKYPIYYVTGNHEYWTRDMPRVLGLFEEYGVIILQDEWQWASINGVDLVIAGVCDPARAQFEGEYDPRAAAAQAFADLPDAFCLLLAHRPTWVEEYTQYPFDLVVSGHNHGGQVRLPPLLYGLVGPDEGFFPQYPGGIYQVGDASLAVTRGLAINYLPRVFNPPELMVLEISGPQ